MPVLVVARKPCSYPPKSPSSYLTHLVRPLGGALANDSRPRRRNEGDAQFRALQVRSPMDFLLRFILAFACLRSIAVRPEVVVNGIIGGITACLGVDYLWMNGHGVLASSAGQGVVARLLDQFSRNP